MGRPKKIKDDDSLLKTITIRVPINMNKHMKKICISMSKQEGRFISVSEFIRNILVKFCPIEKQMDFISKPQYERIKKYKPKTNYEC